MPPAAARPGAFAAHLVTVLLAVLAAPEAGGAEEADFRARLSVVRPENEGLQRLEAGFEAAAGGLYGGMRGRGDQEMGVDAEAVVYAGFRRTPGDGSAHLSYNYRLGLLGRDPAGRLSLDLDRQLPHGMELGAIVHLDDGLDSGGAAARAGVDLGPDTTLTARLERPINNGGADDIRTRLRLERHFTGRDARLGVEISQADTPPRAAISFRMPF